MASTISDVTGGLKVPCARELSGAALYALLHGAASVRGAPMSLRETGGVAAAVPFNHVCRGDAEALARVRLRACAQSRSIVRAASLSAGRGRLEPATAALKSLLRTVTAAAAADGSGDGGELYTLVVSGALNEASAAVMGLATFLGSSERCVRSGC